MPDFRLTDVDTKLIESTANAIGEDIEVLMSISVALSSSIMTELHPCWQGPAKESFEKQFGAFSDTFRKYAENCKQLNEQLKAAGGRYRGADDAVKQLITQLPK